jgi:hypothetical protein
MQNFYQWMKSKSRRFTEQRFVAPKVLWITGMGSRGQGPRELAAQGYDVKQIGTTTNRFAAYLGFLKQFEPVKQLLGDRYKDLGPSHLATNVKKHDTEMKDMDFVPDVVVGTSQGGAVVMQVAHNYPHSKFVLGAPAWKIFGADPSNLPEDTIIIQGERDNQVLPRYSYELRDKYGFELRTYGIGHTIDTKIIKDAIDTQLKRLGMPIPKPIPAVAT